MACIFLLEMFYLSGLFFIILQRFWVLEKKEQEYWKNLGDCVKTLLAKLRPNENRVGLNLN